MNLPEGQSVFLWGARQTGKSSYLRAVYPQALYCDLLSTHNLANYSKQPGMLYDEIVHFAENNSAPIVIIDEIQKVPELLNEVHRLIENIHVQFILCGSSARKLRNCSTNLLGGRAWVYNFYPLTSVEIGNIDLLRALQHGLLPRHYDSSAEFIDEHLQAYIDVYLTDEIRNEGLVRNLNGFARFLDVAGLTNGQMLNYVNIARDCGIDRSTVQNYYQILVDTWLGYFIYPYNKKVKRDLVTATPKFYMFDVGVANYLAKQRVMGLKGSLAGHAFEHFIFMELRAYLGYARKRLDISYWRTKGGLEVDFVLGNAVAGIEIKISDQVHQKDLRGLIAFKEEHPQAKAIVVSQAPRPRLLEVAESKIYILPWQEFLRQLWSGEIIT